MRGNRIGCLLVFWGLTACTSLAEAGGGFTIGGRPVEPQESNFAGARHVTPNYKIPVQINHDTQTTTNVELAVVDDVFRTLLTQYRRNPYFAPDTLPVVFITDLKMRRFLEGPRRLLFGRLETEIKKQQEVYLSPTAIFITDTTLQDGDKLRAALSVGLSYLFNFDFYRAVVGLDHATPRPAD